MLPAALPALLAVVLLATPQPALSRPAAATTYRELEPILARHCVVCHAGEAAPLGLRLDSYEASLKGGANGPVVKSGDPAASELIRRIRGQARPRMPLDGPPLGDDEIRLLETWVAQGARGTDGVAAGMPAGAVVRLHGILGPGSLLDGLPLVISAPTRADKSPRAGDYVQVRGTLDATGQVRVERIRRR
jgi:mono/diheme cytochrome c family protein